MNLIARTDEINATSRKEEKSKIHICRCILLMFLAYGMLRLMIDDQENKRVH